MSEQTFKKRSDNKGTLQVKVIRNEPVDNLIEEIKKESDQVYKKSEKRKEVRLGLAVMFLSAVLGCLFGFLACKFFML